MIDERTKQDIIRAANNFNTIFPNSPISYPEMLKRFNESQHLTSDSFLAPIYEEESYRKFIQFSKNELDKLKSKNWVPPKVDQQEQNENRRRQIKKSLSMADNR